MKNVPYASANPCDLYWTTVKNILKYLVNTKDMFLVYGGAVDWKSTKQSIFATSSTEAEYIDAYNASKEAVWVRKFISGLGVVPTIEEPINMYCNNTRAITIANESGITKGARHFHVKVQYLREVIEYGDIKLEKVHTDDNLAALFTTALAFPKHSKHTRNIGMLPTSRLMQTVKTNFSSVDINFDWHDINPYGLGRNYLRPRIINSSSDRGLMVTMRGHFFWAAHTAFLKLDYKPWRMYPLYSAVNPSEPYIDASCSVEDCGRQISDVNTSDNSTYNEFDGYFNMDSLFCLLLTLRMETLLSSMFLDLKIALFMSVCRDITNEPRTSYICSEQTLREGRDFLLRHERADKVALHYNIYDYPTAFATIEGIRKLIELTGFERMEQFERTNVEFGLANWADGLFEVLLYFMFLI
uniref:Retrotransposon protein, putative, Ty1-copia subclass n=1 Tax=Tanacetum cinerariifolium TaxID=118510 RepID=A0A6L2P422_TANCI|nr:hypothetical protein [Tanacetum cinerariifolium]